MGESVTIRLDGNTKITSMYSFLNRYEKLGYSIVDNTTTPIRRRRKKAEEVKTEEVE